MTSQQVGAVLARADVVRLKELADTILAASDYQLLQPPTTGKIMMQVVEAVEHQRFFLGDVLMTECEVRVGAGIGQGHALGEEPDRALWHAVVQAVWADAQSPLHSHVLAFVEQEQAAIAMARGREAALVARTHVHFETLEDQDAQHKGSRL